jgi:hypothetical protein
LDLDTIGNTKYILKKANTRSIAYEEAPVSQARLSLSCRCFFAYTKEDYDEKMGNRSYRPVINGSGSGIRIGCIHSGFGNSQ